jgi:peptide/nickel transport system substrate-binding protein
MGRITRHLAFAAAVAAALLAATPLAAQTLRVNVTGDPGMIDPITYSELVAGRVLRNVYEAFTDVTAEGEIVNRLAESWEPLEGEHGFRFNLREGVTFHSGRPFTADDVKYTYETLLDPEARGGLNARYLVNIVGAEAVREGETSELEGVTIIDDHTLEVRFTQPEVLFPIYPIFIMDSGIVEEHGENWMFEASGGTGPFVFDDWQRGVDVTITANPDYWMGAPKLEGIRFVIVPSPDTALSQYDAGELDFLDVQSENLRRVLRDDGYADELQLTPRAQSRYLSLNPDVYEPFKDVRVRQAVSLVLDRDAMIEGLYDGAGFHLNGIITPGVAGYNPDLPKLEHDPEKARALLAEAGYPGGVGMPPLDVTSTSAFTAEITYYANQLSRELGIPASVNVMERGNFIRTMNAGELAMVAWGWTSGFPDAMYYLEQMWLSDSPFNRGRWRNERYDELIREAIRTVDDEARFKLYHEAEKVFVEDMGAAPLPMIASVALVKPYVKNARITPYGFDSFHETEIDR